MKELSTEPDEWMQWIYDPTHPAYHSPDAEDLRERRARAFAQVPPWMHALPEEAR